MIIKELNRKSKIDKDNKLNELFSQFEKLLAEIRKIKLPDLIVDSINQDIEDINSTPCSGDGLRSMIKKKQAEIIKLLENELKLVPKNYYRKFWLAVGMAAFGLPLGAFMGITMGNMAFLGIGLPIGMAIGIGVGTRMDKKASEEGRQLDIEIKA